MSLMSRLLILLCLLSLLPTQSLASTTNYSLSGYSPSGSVDVAELESQLAELNGRDALTQNQSRDKAALESALRFASERSRTQQGLKDLKKRVGKALSERTKLNQALSTRQPVDRDSIIQQYAALEITELAQRLSDTLAQLEQQQEELASVSSELINFQTLPERAQTILARDLQRSEMLRQQLAANKTRSTLSEAELAAIKLELAAINNRIELSRLELWNTDSLRSLAELRKQWLSKEVTEAELRLDLLQTEINQKHQASTEKMIAAALGKLPEKFSNSAVLKKAMNDNRQLADELLVMTVSTNSLIRDNIRIENTLDRTRQALRSLNEQIDLLQGGMLLARIVYSQQASLQRTVLVEDLEQSIAELRLRQFHIHQQQQALLDRDGYISTLTADTKEPPNEETRNGLIAITDIRVGLLHQLDNEVSRQLNLSINIHLNQQQLEANHRALRNTVIEQSFWMPSNHNVDLDWIRTLPTALQKQAKRLPIQEISVSLFNSVKKNWWFVTPFLIISLLLLSRRNKLNASLLKLNTDIGRVREDSQKHTPLALFYSLLINMPVPLLLFGLSVIFYLDEGTYQKIASLILLRLAAAWLVFLWCYRLLNKGGIGERHFRWPAENIALLRLRILAIGTIIILLLPITTISEQWPERLAEDRIGLLAFTTAMLCLTFLLYRLAMAWPFNRSDRGQLLQRVTGYPLATLPLALLALAMAGYFYSSVKVAGRLLDSFYLLLLWLLLQASAKRGLAVAARRLSFSRALAKRSARQEAREREDSGEGGNLIEEPELAVEKINQQSLRLLRISLLALLGTALYWVWSDLLDSLGYMDNVILWESISGSGDTLQVSHTSLANLVSGLLVILTAALLIYNLPGLLEVLIFSRLSLPTGTSYTIATSLKYIIFSVALVSSLGALGFEWSKLQWLIAALGVGLGFGLQEIFANFVSGLIILFERPIRIGDTITIANLSGTVSKIRIRATTIIDFDRKEIIVPNKTFVTDQLVNWTLTDPVTRITLKIGFAYGSDLQKIRQVLLQAAKENARVMEDPEPQVLFVSFGGSTLDHEMRVHVRELSDRLRATDELNRRIDTMCKEEGLEIAFNQLDVHLYNNNGDSALVESKKTEAKKD